MKPTTVRLLLLSIVLPTAACPARNAAPPRQPTPAPATPTITETPPAEPVPAPVVPPPPVEDQLVLDRVTFADLPGWTQDDVAQTVPAFLRSCQKLRRMKDHEQVGRTPTGGKAADWRRACDRAAKLRKGDTAAARTFFEEEFVPFLAKNNDDPIGRFTGYYEARLRGSRRRHGKYKVPLHKRPADLITVELSRFLSDARGRRLAGRVVGKKLEPYDTRAQIVGGSLAKKKLELVWLDDAVDAFFVQVQGSGNVQLDTGEQMRIGYAATNGRRYTAIGRVLIAEGHLTKETVSMQSIREYLNAHPKRADEVMNQNESYVFFTDIGGDGPIGSQGVVLTAGRSIAIDRQYIPQSAPVWLDTMAPVAGGTGEEPLQRLVVAQDTGGAILGPVRADVYWGGDDAAADVAGRMKGTGRYFLLLPQGAAQSILAR